MTERRGLPAPRFGSASVQALPKRRKFRCKECGRDFTAKVGTIFEQSAIPFTKWLPAMWLLANTKNGTSSHELGRALGVTQKTAWFMLHRVRESMKDENPPMLAGEVEADETFVGGEHQHLPTRTNAIGKKVPIGGPAAGKTTVFGMVQRGAGKASACSRDGRAESPAATLIPKVYGNVVTGSTLYTDALRSYRQTDRDFIHQFIDHSIKYVNGAFTRTPSKLLVVREADAARQVYRGSTIPPQRIP